jgi:small subunit ribosomal protein S8
MTSDPIADMLTRVRNAMRRAIRRSTFRLRKLKAEIARILKEEGYIANFKVAEEGVKKVIKIYLKYASDNFPVISASSAFRAPAAGTTPARTKFRRCRAASESAS